jgi:hypothetical protein
MMKQWANNCIWSLNLLPAKLLKQPKEMAPYMDMCFYLLSTVCILECICCVMILIISWWYRRNHNSSRITRQTILWIRVNLLQIIAIRWLPQNTCGLVGACFFKPWAMWITAFGPSILLILLELTKYNLYVWIYDMLALLSQGEFLWSHDGCYWRGSPKLWWRCRGP